MIKLTHIPSSRENAPAFFLIPGGPGLSSNTLRSLDLLKRSFDLYYVDLPGCNGVPFDSTSTMESLTLEISNEIEKIGKPAFVLGHSFGGYLASSVATSSKMVRGMICVSVPFSKESQKSAVENYSRLKNPELQIAELEWERLPSDLTFLNWLSRYGQLYFSGMRSSAGQILLQNDQGSFQLFQALRKEAKRADLLLPRLKAWGGSKLFIAGSDDSLLPIDSLKPDSNAGGFDFFSIVGASHFSMHDQPELVANLIETVLTKTEG